MTTKDIITAGLILAAILAVGDKLWSIALAAVLVIAAAAIQPKRRNR